MARRVGSPSASSACPPRTWEVTTNCGLCGARVWHVPVTAYASKGCELLEMHSQVHVRWYANKVRQGDTSVEHDGIVRDNPDGDWRRCLLFGHATCERDELLATALDSGKKILPAVR